MTGITDREKAEARDKKEMNMHLFYDDFLVPVEDYDRKKFMRVQDNLNELEKNYRAFREDGENDTARRNLTGILFHDTDELHRKLDTYDLRRYTEGAISGGQDRMVRYVEKNKDDMFDLLDENRLFGMIQKLPVYKSDKESEKEHNELVDWLNDTRTMARIKDGRDSQGRELGDEAKIGNMREYVGKKTNLDKVPEEVRGLVNELLKNDEYVVFKFNKNYRISQNLMLSRFTSDGKNLDKHKLRTFIETSLDSIKDQMDDEPKPGKKKDMWEQMLRPYYAELGRQAFSAEEEEDDRNNEGVHDKNERKAKRKKLGMPL